MYRYQPKGGTKGSMGTHQSAVSVSVADPEALPWVAREEKAGEEHDEEVHDAERKCMGWLMVSLFPLIAAFAVHRSIYK